MAFDEGLERVGFHCSRHLVRPCPRCQSAIAL
jgi:hypothetical protein